jgi:hypothetical protein
MTIIKTVGMNKYQSMEAHCTSTWYSIMHVIQNLYTSSGGIFKWSEITGLADESIVKVEAARSAEVCSTLSIDSDSVSFKIEKYGHD